MSLQERIDQLQKKHRGRGGPRGGGQSRVINSPEDQEETKQAPADQDAPKKGMPYGYKNLKEQKGPEISQPQSKILTKLGEAFDETDDAKEVDGEGNLFDEDQEKQVQEALEDAELMTA